MNHGARMGLCSPASYEPEVIRLNEVIAELKLTPWQRFKRWLKALF
jgi:hypothetical protein